VKYTTYKKFYLLIFFFLLLIVLILPKIYYVLFGEEISFWIGFFLLISISVLTLPWFAKDFIPFEDIKQPGEYLNELLDGLKNDGVDVVNEALSSLAHPFNLKREKEKTELMRWRKERERMEYESNRNGLDLLDIKANINDKIQNTNITKRQVRLLDKILDELQLDNINPAQCLLLVKALDTSANSEAQILMNSEMIKEQLNKMKAETEILNQKAKQEKAQARMTNYDVLSEIREDVKRKRTTGNN
jgi:hypothetical protein